MSRASVFLKTELFTVSGPDQHVPSHAVIIEGELKETSGGSITIAVETYKNAKGELLNGSPQVLLLSTGKIDHIHLTDES